MKSNKLLPFALNMKDALSKLNLSNKLKFLNENNIYNKFNSITPLTTSLTKKSIQLSSTTTATQSSAAAKKDNENKSENDLISSNTTSTSSSSSLETNLIDWIKNDDEDNDETKLLHADEPKFSIVKPKVNDRNVGDSDNLNTNKYNLNVNKLKLSRESLQKRSLQLIQLLAKSQAAVQQAVRLQELNKHLIANPECIGLMIENDLQSLLLCLREQSDDHFIRSQCRQSLALIGYVDPPKGNGVRILALDGGGARGRIIIETLKTIEQLTNQPIYKLFDVICGVSVGAMIGFLVGGLRMSIEDCERIYKRFTIEMFESNLWSGAQRLLWTHAYYDSQRCNELLKEVYTEKLLIETSAKENAPKLIAISSVVNTPILKPFVFRNYNPREQWNSDFEGDCSHKIWHAIRATSAAPGYFEEFQLDQYLHQDGGILINNPTAVAVHEAQVLWPNEAIQCCISIGCGKYAPVMEFTSDHQQKQQQQQKQQIQQQQQLSFTSIKTKLSNLITSATDTEIVHRLLQDLMKPGTYFRFNPLISDHWSLDENREEMINQMLLDTQMYIRKNEHKFNLAKASLMQKRSINRRVNDWLQVQYATKKGSMATYLKSARNYN